MYKQLFTSESVGAGHPDKICDQISDAILDKALAQDENSRVAIEVLASNRLIVISGEITTKAKIDYEAVALEVLKPLGYSKTDFKFIINVHAQSPDIKQGVELSQDQIGAGDQGIIFGYATNETSELMPLPITLAHALAARAESLRRDGEFQWAKSDLKTQVTIDYSANPIRIDTILMSVQHDENYDPQLFKDFIVNQIMKPVATKYGLNEDFKVLINPTGRFVIGGPIGDTGLTGRKIIVDTYGGMGRHGGGCFSGKDYTKVDRSAAYAARWVAKNLVAAGVADRVEVQLAYAIGVAQPISIAIETFGETKYDSALLQKVVTDVFDLTPSGIIKALDLKHQKYLPFATFGHFGNHDGRAQAPWESLNRVDEIKDSLPRLQKVSTLKNATNSEYIRLSHENWETFAQTKTTKLGHVKKQKAVNLKTTTIAKNPRHSTY